MSSHSSNLSGPAGAPHRILITLSVMLASIMQALDITIANVALPHIRGSLSTTQDQMSWVLTSYIIAAAIMTPLSGWLAGQVGRRRVFLYSIVGFTLSSAFCGLAQSLPEMVLARILQGLCGAALIPMSQAVLLDINPPEKHARAMAIWVMGVIIGPILGPALGGWLTENYSWRWVFYINLPFGILAFLGVALFMPEAEIKKSPFDFMGFIFLSLAIGSFQLMLDRGQIKDWFTSTEIMIEAMIAGLALFLFIVHMLTSRKKLFVSPALFRDRNFLIGGTFIFIVGIVLFATLALLPSLLHDLMKYPVVLTGLVTSTRGMGSLVAIFIVSRMVNIVDARWMIATGFALTAYSLWQMTAFYLQMDTSVVVWSGLIQGLGTGFVTVPLAAITFATLPVALRNEGTAMFSLIRNLGSSVGISLVEVLLARNTQVMHARLAEQVTPFQGGLHALSQAMLTTQAGLTQLNELVTRQASMIAYNNNFKLMMILTLCTIPLVLLFKKSKTKSSSELTVME